MALVRFGGGVSEIRGSIAGNVFGRSRAGAVIRNRAVPVNPNTPSQSEVRAQFQLATDYFKELSLNDILELDEFASTQERTNRLGEKYVPSGKQIFMQAVLNRQLINPTHTFAGSNLAALIGDPNLPNMPEYEIDATNTAGVLTALSLDTVGIPGELVTHVVIQATQQTVPTIRNAKRYMRQIACLPYADPLDILAAYTLIFPTTVSDPVVGNVIHFRARALNEESGMGGAWIYVSKEIPEEV